MPLPDQVLCLYEPESTSVFVNREALVDGTLPALSTPVAVCRTDRHATTEGGWEPVLDGYTWYADAATVPYKTQGLQAAEFRPFGGPVPSSPGTVQNQRPHDTVRLAPVPGRTGRRAAQRVSWYDAVALCNQMSSDALLPPAYAIDGEQVA